MRLILCIVSAFLAAAPAFAQQTIAPGNAALRPDHVRPFTDTLVLLVTPRDSAQRMYGTLVRRVERARDGGEPILRETQRYEYSTGGTEIDTLDVSVATFAPRRVVEINSSARQALRLANGRIAGTVWSADSGAHAINDTIAHPFFHGMMTEAFIAGFPLALGSVLHLPVGETPRQAVHMAEFRVTGTTTLRTARGLVECLVVQESTTVVGWVSKADGHLVRLHWVLPNGTSIWKLPRRDVPFVASSGAMATGA